MCLITFYVLLVIGYFVFNTFFVVMLAAVQWWGTIESYVSQFFMYML